MNRDDEVGGAGRRLALKQAAGIGAVVFWAALGASAATPPKLTKEAVKYTDTGNVEGKDCDDCSQYVAPKSGKGPASCKIVEGPIDPHGHCIAFSPKPASR